MKPFDLKAAKAGAPVCTRDGRKARIICFDREPKQYPIVALVTYYNPKNGEHAVEYTEEGRYYTCKECENDLMMVTQKKEGWINILSSKEDQGRISDGPYISKEEALSAIKENMEYVNHIATAKIEWEE